MAPARVTYSVHGSHPRIWFRSTDKAALLARASSGIGPNDWQSWAFGQLNNYVAGTYPSTSMWPNAYFQKSLAYSVAAYLNDNANYAKQALDHAVYVAGQSTAGTSIHDKREAVLGMASAFDLCYQWTTLFYRTAIADGIIKWIDAMEYSPDDAIDGYTRNHQACAAVGALAIYGESGYTTSSTARLDKALDFWYGGNNAVTTSGNAAMDLARFYSSDGGSAQGPWYGFLSGWGTFLLMNSLSSAMTSMTLDGDAYSPFDNENWVDDFGLWWLHVGLRGDGDHFRFGDTLKQENPVFKQEMRLVGATLAKYGNWKRQMKWWWDQWQNRANALGQGKSYERTLDFILIDKATNTALAPVDTPNMPKARVFERAGVVSYVSNWDKPQGTQFLLHFPRYYYRGHLDLEVGAVQVAHKQDMVLLNRGYYHTTPANGNEDYGGAHNNGWQKQTISKSGVILCDDGSATPHSNYNVTGVYTAYPSAEGGQYWKTFNSGSVKDPENVTNLLTQGGGLAWLRVEGRTSDKGVDLIYEDSSVVYFYANCRRAYHKEYTEQGGGSERLRRIEFRGMIIKDQGPGGCLLYFARTESRLSSMTKQQVWHFWGNPLLSSFATSGQFGAPGYASDQGLPGGGQCVVSYFDAGNFTATQTGNGTATAYGDHQFWYDPHDGSGGKNYPPTAQPNTDRHKIDLGRFRASVKPKTAATQNDFVTLVIPLDPNQAPPAFEWLTVPDFYGVRFPDGKVYQIAKTSFDFISPGSAVDTTPPVAVTLSGGTAGSGQAQLTWVPVSGDSTMTGGRYKVYRRVKV